VNINATLFVQIVVFAILVWFTMRFVWPPIMAALDERALKIADGLKAADNARLELGNVRKQVEAELTKTRVESATRLADAEARAATIVEQAKVQAQQEAARIIEVAKAEAQHELLKGREVLREQLAGLVVKGAEQILHREVNAQVHADLLTRLKTEL